MRVSKAEIKYFRSLSQKKVRQTEKKFLLEGWRAVKELLNSSSKVETVAVLTRYLHDPDYDSILAKLSERGATIKEVSEIELGQVADTVQSQGVFAVVQQQTVTLESVRLSNASLVVAADSVSDPGNLGSIIRSADWFSADLVLLGRGCVELYNDKVLRSMVGSLFHVPVVEGADLPAVLTELRKKGLVVASFAGDGKESYTELKRPRGMVLVFGSEAHGISKEVRATSDNVVRIPKYGKAESLNVGVACGIVLAHLRAQ
ncbi:MAG TPA: RNA methyltransferase, partial [Bacteroidota bacterium]|nr:RNA methyltransferase [Bacteroidota bacterium]